MRATSPEKELMTVAEVAALYGVHDVTIRRWIAKGLMGIVRVGPGGRVIRITRVEAMRHWVETPGAKT